MTGSLELLGTWSINSASDGTVYHVFGQGLARLVYDPRMPLVTLIQRLCGRHVPLDGSIQSDRLRQRGYRIDVHAGLLQKLSICRGSAIGKFAHRLVEVPMLLNVIGHSLEI